MNRVNVKKATKDIIQDGFICHPHIGISIIFDHQFVYSPDGFTAYLLCYHNGINVLLHSVICDIRSTNIRHSLCTAIVFRLVSH